MARHLIATAADSNYVRYAKQVLASIYLKAGWRGDYMLLASEVSAPDRSWFHDHGILVKDCEPVFTEREWESRLPDLALEGTSKYSVATTAKFHLLLPEFRRWDTVVYLDVDIIVRASLNSLTKVRQFAAVSDYGKTIRDQFVAPEFSPSVEGVVNELGAEVSLDAKTFNAGVLAFPTAVIEETSFDRMIDIARRYLSYARYGDQLAWNLYFYGKWKPLSSAYNYFVYYLTDLGRTADSRRFYGAVLHFPGLDQRPWHADNVFHSEWKSNFDRADELDASHPASMSWSRRVKSGFLLSVCKVRDSLTEKTL